MTNHALLDNITHKDLKILPGYRTGQGFDISTARVFPIEFSDLQMEYPIVLTRNKETGHFEPVVLLGLSLIHISEPTRPTRASRMPSSA